MPRPNIIVFFTDQQRWDTSSLHGNPMELTPNLDRMAQEGTHFCNTITCQPVCGPARSTLQTGKYATNTGVWRNGLGLAADEPTLARYFADAGYATAYIGKWHLYEGTGSVTAPYGSSSGDPVPRDRQGGYEFWRGANLLEFVSNAYDLRLFDEAGKEHRYPGYRVDAQTDLAIRYIDEHRDAPFFLFLSYLEPHHQNHVDAFVPPKGYEERYRDCWVPPDLQALGGSSTRQLPGYYGTVKKLDEALGRIDDALTSMRLNENTIVLYISDHGCHFRTRIGYDKRSGHEASVRVPCMAKGPGFDGGGRIPELFSLVDIPPTLLDAASLPVPETMEGASILPLLRGDNPEWHDDVFIQISESCVGRAVRTRRWKYIVAEQGSHGFDAPGDSMVERSAAETYVETELYDLEYDPYELRNLAGMSAYRAVADRLKERLLKRIEAVEDRRPAIVNAPEQPSGQALVLPGESGM